MSERERERGVREIEVWLPLRECGSTIVKMERAQCKNPIRLVHIIPAHFTLGLAFKITSDPENDEETAFITSDTWEELLGVRMPGSSYQVLG